jgi:hypothetical protein
MARFATPQDIARTVAFLADPEWSGFVNGHTLSVDGGWFADGSWESLRRSKVDRRRHLGGCARSRPNHCSLFGARR